MDLAVPVTSVDHSRGPEHAPVTLVEYGDFECPTCRHAAPAVEILLQRFPEKVRFVYRHFPLVEVHPHAFAAAEAAECAGGQGKFWEMHAQLFEHQSHLDSKHLLRYADDIGLDLARYQAEMNDEVYRQRVQEHIDSGKRSRVRATPSFYVNGRLVDVSFGLQDLLTAVERELG